MLPKMPHLLRSSIKPMLQLPQQLLLPGLIDNLHINLPTILHLIPNKLQMLTMLIPLPIMHKHNNNMYKMLVNPHQHHQHHSCDILPISRIMHEKMSIKYLCPGRTLFGLCGTV